jgi:hypothetical protein
MPLVYTTTEGPDSNIVELLTVNQNVERPLCQDLARLVDQLGGPLGTVKGVPLDGVAGVLQNVTAFQQGAMIRVSGFVGQSIAAGTYDNFSTNITNQIKLLDIDPTGDVIFTGIEVPGGNAGCWFVLGKFGADGRIILRHNTGSAAANRFFCPGGIDYVLSNNLDTVLIWYFNTRFQVVDKLPQQATISVVVPAVAVATLAYLDVSTVGTSLAGIISTDTVVGNPVADLAAAGVNAGAYEGCRVSAASTIRMTFRGLLAGGAVNFNFVKVD